MHRIAVSGFVPVLFATFGMAGSSSGATPAPGVAEAPIVTEDEFLAVLDASHPAVAESVEALALARARTLAVATLDNPVLGVDLEDPSGPARETVWALSWQLPSADRRPRIAASEEAAGAASARLEQRLTALRLGMKEIYAEWALATARHERLAAQAERVGALAAREHERERRGESSGLEARRLDLAVGGLRARVALAAAATEQARSRAAGWNPSLPAGARPALPDLPAVPEPASDHPSVRAAERDLAAAQLERQAAGRFVRTPDVTLGWQRQEDLGASIDGPVLGVAWSLPLLARGRAEKAASEARVSAARARLERARREIEAARAGARAAFERLATAVEDAVAAQNGNERMLDGAEAAFRIGETSLTDLLEIHRSVTESELAVLDLRQAALAARRELERATGGAADRPESSSANFETHDQENHP